MGPDSYGNIGIAVNSSGTVAAISNFMTSMVLLLSLPTGEPFHAFGGSGTEPGQFRTISRLCFLQSDKSLIIADARNRRLQVKNVVLFDGLRLCLCYLTSTQEVSLAGEHMRTIGSGVFTSDVISVATCPSYIAAGTIGEGNQVYLFSADTSDFIRSFGWKGSGEGQLRQSVGLRFTPDGSHIVVADDESNRLGRFTLSGEFVQYIGAGLLLEPQDVVFASNGDAIVADSSNNRICVFTPNGSALLRSFGSEGDAPGQFKCPVGLAIHGNTLYVIDTLTARLQIFQ